MKLTVSADDESIRSEWTSNANPPVIFIIGLHRSGTTFLYETLSRVLPVAKLTVQDVVGYTTLVTNYLRDGGRHDCQSLTAYFERHQITTRGRDALLLSPATAEEYGWILKTESGSYSVGDRSLDVLKNPWDTGNVDTLAREFPGAKFVFLRRDPMEIVNSELGNMLYFMETRDPLIKLLTKEIPSTRILLMITRIFRRLLGKQLFSRLYVRLILKDVADNVHKFNISLTCCNPKRALEITYENLIDNPRQTLESVASFAGLDIDKEEASGISPKRRDGGLSPLVSKRKTDLCDYLTKAAERGSST
jgi:hypothetical protein